MKAVLTWGNQLSSTHHSALSELPDAPVIMIESRNVSSKFKYHKQKLRFVLTAMRDYRDELRSNGRTVFYSQLEESEPSFFDELRKVCAKHDVDELLVMRQSDKTPQKRLVAWCDENSIKLNATPNTLFLTPTSVFDEWAESQKRLHFEMFYRWQRQRLDIMMDGNKPDGGKWNYDAENRKPLPKDVTLPKLSKPKPSAHAKDVEAIINKYFDDHPGSLEINWLPTSRSAAQQWLEQFIEHRFEYFGAYEDAMKKDETFLYHSALSALMNIGLLHPEEAVSAALDAKVPLASKEGFVRQVIGWREFMFGLYNFKADDWIESNFFDHTDKLPEWWWKLTDAPEPPLEDALKRLERYGYSHHIERLMIFGNYMLLAGYKPGEAYKWFMTMYVDAYEWVMVPNVIGMSQYADGGLDRGGFATKPYISGSNYLQKMGRWWSSGQKAKESDWTPMYWDFLERHRDKLESNHRLRPLYARFKK